MALVVPGKAAIVVGIRVVRIEADRLRIIRDGLRIFLLPIPGEAAIGIGFGVFRIETERRLKSAIAFS